MATPLTLSVLSTSLRQLRLLRQFGSTPRLNRISVFTTYTASELWKSATGVSRQGKKKGRGKKGDVKAFIDLNRKRKIGYGPSGKQWPGLTQSPFKGAVVEHQHTKPDLEYETERTIKVLDDRKKARTVSRRQRMKLFPLQRGWQGRSMRGVLIGPPDPILDYDFKGFESTLLEMKSMNRMTGTLGRKRVVTAMIITGNRTGLFGIGVAEADQGAPSVRRARNRAGQRLQFFELCDNRTIWHDFFEKEDHSKIYVERRERGHGLTCCNVIKSMCNIIGIKDLYAKVEGSTNPMKVAVAFANALAKQETHQQLADRTGLLVVEKNPRRGNIPEIVARPLARSPRETYEPDEELNVRNLYIPPHMVWWKKENRPFWYNFPGHQKRLRDLHKWRNQYICMIDRLAHE